MSQDQAENQSKRRPTDDSAQVRRVELAHLGKTEEDRLTGLAISGGGIRSASFALGMIQALHNYKNSEGTPYLDTMDYLSTVSGGGYIGSSLTWFMEKGTPWQDENPKKPDFPFGRIGAGDRVGTRKHNTVLDFIRQHASYLSPGNGINALSFTAVVLRGMIVSLLIYFAIATVILVGLTKIKAFDPAAGPFAFLPDPINNSLAMALATIVVIVIAAFWFSVRTFLRLRGPMARYHRDIWGQKAIGRLWVVAIGLGLLGSLPLLLSNVDPLWAKLTAGGVSTGLGALLGFFQFKKEQSPGDGGTGAMGKSRVIIGAAVLVYGVVLLAFILGSWIAPQPLWWAWTAGILVGAVTFGTLVNLNYSSLNRVYRDRLMETFMANRESLLNNQWGPATDADGALLETMCQRRGEPDPSSSPPVAPYHLINTNVVLVDSPVSRFRGRGGDNFILSPLYCGSDATGWCPTGEYMKHAGSRGMTLATAMAISGAAVNPHAGVSGKGVTRDKLVSVLLALLNLRLGYWAANPKYNRRIHIAPNYLVPGLREIVGAGFHEDSREIELTDGGHFENLALYELIRRKVKLIILSDAGADPNFDFGSLANAVERVRVDFGVEIRFDDPVQGLHEIKPGSADHGGLLDQSELATRGYAVGRIVYDLNDKASKEKNGTLIYIKSTLVRGLPADLIGYKKANAAFPNQSTADQFFDEEQFEAYRELGYQLTKRMIKENNYSLPRLRWGADVRPSLNQAPSPVVPLAT